MTSSSNVHYELSLTPRRESDTTSESGGFHVNLLSQTSCYLTQLFHLSAHVLLNILLLRRRTPSWEGLRSVQL